MDALNTFLIANASLTALALLGFYSLRTTNPFSKARTVNYAGLSGALMSISMLSVLGFAFL